MNIVVILFRIVLFIGIIFLSNCYSPSKEYIEKQARLTSFYQQIQSYCQIDLNNDLDWHIATIYYQNNEYILKDIDKQILDKLISLQAKCNKNILLIANVSDFEYLGGAEKALKLSQNRANSVYQYLVKNKVDKSYIYILSCSNLAKRKLNEFEENDSDIINNNIHKYNDINQFVEIIFLNTSPDLHKDDCFKNKLSINKDI